MEARLALPILLLVAAVSLAGGVDQALRPTDGRFQLEPGGPAAGGWTAITMVGRFGSSPELVWHAPPAAADSFVLIAEDLDAPAEERFFWTVWNIPGHTRRLPPGLPRDTTGDGPLRQGQVHDGRIGYAAPELGAVAFRRLRFSLFAVKGQLDLAPGASVAELYRELRGRDLDMTVWTAGGGWS